MPFVQLELTDIRPAAVLRLVGGGMTARDAAAKLGINRKTVERWRQRVPGFGDAYNLAAALSRDDTPEAGEKLDGLVQTWTPTGLIGRSQISVLLPPVEALPEPEPTREQLRIEDSAPPPTCIEPDILDANGMELAVQGDRREISSPYTTVRPPTKDEWLAEMAALALDRGQPERVRVMAGVSVSALLQAGAGGRWTRPAEVVDAAVVDAAREQGRDPGVSASVWQEVKEKFLGPAPDQEPDAKRSGDVVEFERAPPG
jgi:hypothetical protein